MLNPRINFQFIIRFCLSGSVCLLASCVTVSMESTRNPDILAALAEVNQVLPGVRYSSVTAEAVVSNFAGLGPWQGSHISKITGQYQLAMVNRKHQLVIRHTTVTSRSSQGSAQGVVTGYFTQAVELPKVRRVGDQFVAADSGTIRRSDFIRESESLDTTYSFVVDGPTLTKHDIQWQGQAMVPGAFEDWGAMVVHSDSSEMANKLAIATRRLVEVAKNSREP